MAWRDYVKYPDLCCGVVVGLAGVELMDALDELIPIEDTIINPDDRVGVFLDWIRAGMEAGLLDMSDKLIIQKELVHGCGGL